MDLVLTPGAMNRINQMINFKPKHFTKLPYEHVGLKELCELFPEHNSMFVRAKMETTYWTKFCENKSDKFELLICEVVNYKKRNMDTKLSDILSELTN